MIGALLYYRLTSLRNWLSRRLARLRKPKYLVGAVAGAAYIWFFFLRQTSFANNGPAGRPGVQVAPLAIVLCALVLASVIRLVVVWLAPEKPGLGFTEAEIAFLFPAPMTRRMLVNYKLLNTQFTILISALLISLISHRWDWLGGNTFIHFVGWWIMTSTLSLHSMGAAMTVARLAEKGIRPSIRTGIIWTAVALYLGAVGYAAWRAGVVDLVSASQNGRPPLALMQSVVSAGGLRWLLFPFRIVLGPFFSQNLAQLGVALVPALLLLAAHYVWVYKSDASFEEASIAQAEKMARRIAAMQAGRFPHGKLDAKSRKAPFPLNPAGGLPETAFLWKNLLSTREMFSLRTFVGAAILVMVVCTLLVFDVGGMGRSMLRVVGVMSGVLAVYTILLGPQVARQDLRRDLANSDLLKSYPLPGWRIVLGQLLAPVAILSGILWLCVIAGSIALRFASPQPPGTGLVVAGALSLAVLVPIVCIIQLLIPNAGVLLFPSWAGSMRTRDRGIDVMGQRMLFVFGQMVTMLLVLVPALAFGVLLGFAAYWILPAAVSLVVGAVGGLGFLLSEVAFGLAWLGQRFEAFDLTAEPVP